MAHPHQIAHPIILFDGVCNYCNTMVNISIKRNRKRNLRFAPLQSPLAAALKQQYHIPPHIDSVILIEQGKAYVHSSAALRICRHLSFPFVLLYGLLIVPKTLRDWVYAWVARNRYKWFGKKDSCMVPTKEIRELFLDQAT